MIHTIWRRPVDDKTYLVSIDGEVQRTEGTLINSRGFKRKIKPIRSMKIMTVVYKVVNLSQKQHYIHQLVCGFRPKQNHKLEVNHKDGNKFNNLLENLEWVTKSKNIQHAYDMGLNHGDFGQGARLGGIASGVARRARRHK